MKTLVDEIRDMVREARTRGMYPELTDAASDLLGRSCWSEDDEADLFAIIADRIEREYMPRPRFEDGELVEVGDEIDANGTRVKVKSYVVDYDGLTTFLDGKRKLGHDLEPGKPAKRWKPEVLDADGVPIKVGDTVYYVVEGTEYEVVGLHGGTVDVKAIGIGGDNATRWIGPKKLTHKQPDSLESIEEDARKELWHYWGCSGARCAECPALIDGKTPKDHYHTDSCEDAKVLDLLSRQREVLERG